MDGRNICIDGCNMYIAIYLDILSPIRRVNVGMQQEIYDPVKVIHRIKEFTWIMAKLIIFDDTLSKEGSH